jgi:hypothetical protein
MYDLESFQHSALVDPEVLGDMKETVVGLLVGQIIIFGKFPAGGSKLQNRLKRYYNNLRVVYWPAPL